MRRLILILSVAFAAICALLLVISPDFLSLIIVGVMTGAIALGFIFGIIPNIRYCIGLRNGVESIERARSVNADNIWTAITNALPFFNQKTLDGLFEGYLENVRDQEEKGVVISDIEDTINEEALSVSSWRGVILQISGILTALGLLGTFLGLVTGISSVSFSSADATMESIENLLSGIATAFYTSIAGVILSILFNILYRTIWNILLRECELFTAQFHASIQPSAEEQIRAKQYLNTEKMIETLNVIRANSAISSSRAVADPAQEQRMMMDILSGLKNGEFSYLLQPFCNLSDHSVIKAAARLQWNHSVLGEVQPSVYMPIVESDGFIAKLDQYMWNRVCETVRGWIDNGARPVPIVLSIRKTDLLALDVFDTITSMVDMQGLEPRHFEIAIDESAYVICHDEALKTEKQFLQNGYKVSVCNFSGNLVNLGDIAADEVCLDLNALEDYNELESIFSQASKAHIRVTCEGISSAKTLADIKRFGCTVGRGPHIKPVMTRFEFAKLMNYKEDE